MQEASGEAYIKDHYYYKMEHQREELHMFEIYQENSFHNKVMAYKLKLWYNNI